MIRLAFLVLLGLGGVLSLGAFFLARGDGSAPVDASLTAPVIDMPAPVPVTALYFLRDIDLDHGDITLVMFDATPDYPIIAVRDPDVLRAAQTVAYVNAPKPDQFTLSSTAAPQAFAHIYRDDRLIGAVNCPPAGCPDFAGMAGINDAGLIDAAIAIEQVADTFETYDAYINTVQAIADDPNFMLLHARPARDFPAPRGAPVLTIDLPTVINAADTAFDPQTHEALVRDTLIPLLPEGAQISSVTITDHGFAVLGDKDNNRAVMVSGAEIPFYNAQYHSVRVHVSGAVDLPAATFVALSAATLLQYDADRDLKSFVTASLGGSACVDCYVLKAAIPVIDTAQAFDLQPESYSLIYFDLRDAP